jgi:hypothetical protein
MFAAITLEFQENEEKNRKMRSTVTVVCTFHSFQVHHSLVLLQARNTTIINSQTIISHSAGETFTISIATILPFVQNNHGGIQVMSRFYISKHKFRHSFMVCSNDGIKKKLTDHGKSQIHPKSNQQNWRITLHSNYSKSCGLKSNDQLTWQCTLILLH